MAAIDGESARGQLALELRLNDDSTFDNFLALGRSRVVVQALHAQSSAHGEPSMFLHGGHGVGKTHLLQACCQGGGAVYLPLCALRDYPAAEVLEGLEVLPRVCLDDLQAVAGNPAWERALFNLCNRARECGGRLLFAADAAPRALPVALPDLQSRLGWGEVYQLAGPDDESMARILQFRAQRRGLAMSASIAAFIVSRAPRDLPRMLGLLDQLDRESLARGRALSIPFVKQALDW